MFEKFHKIINMNKIKRNSNNSNEYLFKIFAHFDFIISRNLLKLWHNKIYKIYNELFNQKIKSKNMEKNLYIDASHPNETRVVLKSK